MIAAAAAAECTLNVERRRLQRNQSSTSTSDVSDHIQKCILNEFSVTIQRSHWKTVQVVHQPETELKSLTSLVTCARSSQNWNY